MLKQTGLTWSDFPATCIISATHNSDRARNPLQIPTSAAAREVEGAFYLKGAIIKFLLDGRYWTRANNRSLSFKNVT